MSRIERELHTLEVMIGMYCRRRHGTRKADACGECEALLGYARERLRSCRYGEAKPVCSRCRTHCYRADMRARIREVMGWAGPRMLFRHPRLAILHLADSRRR